MTEHNGPALAEMHGFAGRAELYRDRVRLVRDGLAAMMAEVLGMKRAEAETVIRMDLITGFEVYRPMFLPPLVVLHYAGSKPISGRYWHDAFAENVHMAAFFDQRDVEHFAESMEDALRAWISSSRRSMTVADTAGGPAVEGAAETGS